MLVILIHSIASYDNVLERNCLHYADLIAVCHTSTVDRYENLKTFKKTFPEFSVEFG